MMIETRGDLEIRAVGRDAWRISDARLPENDAMRVLGFVERKNGAYEVMRVSNGFEWWSVDGFDAAVDYFAEFVDEGGTQSEHPLVGLYAGATG